MLFKVGDKILVSGKADNSCLHKRTAFEISWRTRSYFVSSQKQYYEKCCPVFLVFIYDSEDGYARQMDMFLFRKAGCFSGLLAKYTQWKEARQKGEEFFDLQKSFCTERRAHGHEYQFHIPLKTVRSVARDQDQRRISSVTLSRYEKLFLVYKL